MTREAAEHICDGEFLWIARATPDGTTWMIDDAPVTLMEVIHAVPSALAEWVIDQTMAALGGVLAGMVGLDLCADGEISVGDVEPGKLEEHFAEVAGLMSEFMQFAHAATVFAAKFERLSELLERERDDDAADGRAAA